MEGFDFAQESSSQADWLLSLGATLLYLTNLLGITLSCMLVFLITGYTSLRHGHKALKRTVIFTSLLLIPLGGSFVRLVRQAEIEARQQERYTVCNIGSYEHTGAEGYFGDAIAPNGTPYVKQTIEQVDQLPIWSIDQPLTSQCPVFEKLKVHMKNESRVLMLKPTGIWQFLEEFGGF